MEKTTKCVDPSFLEGKEPLAVGYKVFDWAWGANGNYNYADENGEVLGSVHTVTGELSKCGWGLHFCRNAIDCMRYRDIIQWNEFALVEAYDELLDCPEDGKSVCRTLKIVKVLSFDDMIHAIKEQSSGISDSHGISNGDGIRDSHGISYGDGIRDGHGISEGYGIRDGDGISNGYGIRYGYGISYGSGIRDGSGISDGYGISNGYGIRYAKFCNAVRGVCDCILCSELRGGYMMIFNKPVSESRFNDVWAKLSSWNPDFTNASELKEKYGRGEWAATPAPLIDGRNVYEVYKEMPDEMVAYIKAMPEFDAEIFKEITGRD